MLRKQVLVRQVLAGVQLEQAGASASALPSNRPEDAERGERWLRAAPTAGQTAEVAEELLSTESGGALVLALNRPAALNALTISMCRSIEAQLRSVNEQQRREGAGGGACVVVVKSALDKAFSAGGDIKGCSLDALDGGEGPDAQFRAEYELMHLVRKSRVPQVALLDGLVMGCGAGLAVNGRFRVATERAVFAMPETNIGFFPDVGANWWLPRVPLAGVGRYIALTGARLNASDLILTGLATHFVPKSRLEELESALSAAAGAAGTLDVASILAAHSSDADLAKSVLRANAVMLEECFGKPTSVAGVVQALRTSAASGSRFAAETLDVLLQKSPMSLKLIWEAMARGASMDFDDVLRMEFRLAMAVFQMHSSGPRSGDVYEGTRAVLVEKLRNGPPRWNPASLDEVDEASVLAAFGPLLGGRPELRLGDSG